MERIANQDSIRTTLTIDGRDCGEWTQGSGGKADSEDVKVTLGAQKGEVAIGGPSKTENKTIERPFDLDVDITFSRWARTRRGRGRCIVKEQALDPEGVPFGAALSILTGILKSVETPSSNSGSADPAKVVLEISTDASVG